MTRHLPLCIVSLFLLAVLTAKVGDSAPSTHGILVVANQKEHTLLLIDPDARRELAKRLAIAGLSAAAMLPAITSVVAPTPAMACSSRK